MNKGLKTFALVGLAACAIGAASALASCDNRDKLVIWAPEECVPLTKTQVERYVSQFEDFPYKLVYENVSEANAVSNVLNDVTAAGDIFFFANDQLARVVQSGALSPVPSTYLSDVMARDASSALEAGMVGNTLYAYPLTNDNGYFVYYDSSLFTPEDMATQEGIIAKLNAYAAEGNVYGISFNIGGSGWYNYAYFYGAGADSQWETDDDGTFTSRTDTYNSAAGKDALLGMQQLMGGVPYFVDSALGTNFAQGSKIVVSGTWDSADVSEMLGDNYAAAPLWEVTVPNAYAPNNEDGSHTYHLGSFSGCKFIGVRQNEDGDKNMWAHSIANYLCDEECQIERFEDRGWGPSNLAAAEDEGVQADPAIVALTKQSDYAKAQGQYPDIWWTATETLGGQVKDAGSTVMTEEQLKYILDTYDSTCDSYLSNTTEGYCICGTLENGSWDNMPAISTGYVFYDGNANEGTYSVDSDGVIHGVWDTDFTVVHIENSLEIDEVETEVGIFRVVDYTTWDGNYGYTELASGSLGYDWSEDNNIALVPGTYHMTFDYSGSTVSIMITAAE